MSLENVEQENVRVVLEGFARFNANEGSLEWRLQALPEAMETFGQPDWDETQTVRRLRWRIATASSGKPSAVVKRTLNVPSRDSCVSAAVSSRRGASACSRVRSDRGSAVTSSQPAASPRVAASYA